MKKIALILATAFLLGSNLYAGTWLLCRNGQAYIHQNGYYFAAGGCYGTWTERLDRVIPVRDPNVPEASDAIYSTLNTPPENPSAQPTEEEKAEIQTLIAEGGGTNVWVNPLKLTTAAYELIYGGTTSLPLFEMSTTINIDTGKNELALYSDKDRDIVVTYKALDMVTITSEVLTVSRGYNSKILNTSSLANGSYIITVSDGDEYEVNLNLMVSH